MSVEVGPAFRNPVAVHMAAGTGSTRVADYTSAVVDSMPVAAGRDIDSRTAAAAEEVEVPAVFPNQE